jgi:hypothetical protein
VRVRADCHPEGVPWRTDEDGSRTYVIWAELLVAEGHEVDAVADALLGELSARHHVVGWERSAGQGLAGTELEVELVDDEQDMAVRRSLLELAETTPGVDRLELADRDPLDPPRA